MTIPSFIHPARYYDRFDPADRYEQHLFLAGGTPQSAEMNELQRAAAYHTATVGDALFADGDIQSGCGITVFPSAGAVECASGTIYVAGTVRSVPALRVSEIDFSGTITIGVRVHPVVVTELDDADLRNPAVGLRTYQDPGAYRLRVDVYWSWSGAVSDDAYFPVYWIDDGVQRPKEPPPIANSIVQGIASYDRDSTGGDYVIHGCRVSISNSPLGDEVQEILVAEGRARVAGFGIQINTSIRKRFIPSPFVHRVNAEPHLSAGGTEVFTFARVPSKAVVDVEVERQVSQSISRGPVAGTSDLLPNDAVVSVVSVTQGATTYTAGVDFLLSGNSIDWSPAGIEPASGSSYTAVYRYIDTGPPVSATSSTFTVSGAVAGTMVRVTYDHWPKRIDVVVLDRDGLVSVVRGVSSLYTPWPPVIAPGLLPLAKLYQGWMGKPGVYQSGVQMVSMGELAAIQNKLDRLLILTATDRLKFDAQFRDQSLKKSLLVDPFADDTIRDQGDTQTAAICYGELRLPVTLSVTHLTCLDGTLLGTVTTPIAQEGRTGEIKIEPYIKGARIPAKVRIQPEVDHWVEYNSNFSSAITLDVTLPPVDLRNPDSAVDLGGGAQVNQSVVPETTLRTSISADIVTDVNLRTAQTLRPIEVQFWLEDFAPNEPIVAVSMDGVPVTNLVEL